MKIMMPINKSMTALSLLMLFSMTHAMENQLTITHKDNEFFVESETESYQIQRCYMDKELRGISPETLAKYAACGARLEATKLEGDDNEYALRLKGGLDAGLHIMGSILYGLTKAVCYVAPAVIAGEAIKGIVKTPSAPIREGRLTTPSKSKDSENVIIETTRFTVSTLGGRESYNAYPEPTPAGKVVGFGGADYNPATHKVFYQSATATPPVHNPLNIEIVADVPKSMLQSNYPVGIAAAGAVETPTIAGGIAQAGMTTAGVVAAGAAIGQTVVNVVGQEAANQMVAATITSTTASTGSYVAAVEATANMAYALGALFPWF